MSHSLNSNRRKQSRAGMLRRSIPVTVAGITLALTSPFAASQKAAENLPPGAMQAKATTSSLECHEARIILQQPVSKGTWTREVDKMIKWGAVVYAKDHDAWVDHPSTTCSPDQ